MSTLRGKAQERNAEKRIRCQSAAEATVLQYKARVLKQSWPRNWSRDSTDAAYPSFYMAGKLGAMASPDLEFRCRLAKDPLAPRLLLRFFMGQSTRTQKAREKALCC